MRKIQKTTPKTSNGFSGEPELSTGASISGEPLGETKPFQQKNMTELGGVSFFNALTCSSEQPNKGLASPSNLRKDPKDSESLGLEIPQHPYPSGVVQFTRLFQALRSLYDVKSGLMGHRKKNQESPVGSTRQKQSKGWLEE